MGEAGHAMRMRCPGLVEISGLVFTLILAPPASVRAQTVTGLVYDDASGGPVAGALVTLLTADSTPLDSTKTDTAGRFELAAPQAGRFHLSVATDDYEAWSTTLQLDADEPTSVLVPLTLRPGVKIDRTPSRASEESVHVFGQVVERGAETPIDAAEVTLVGRGRRTLTNYAGRFDLPDVAAGELTIRIEHLAFETQEATLELAGGWAYQVQVEMSETAIPLEGIEVTVRSRPFARFIQPAYERMDRAIGGHFLLDEDLSIRGYPTVSNSLRGLPSVRVPPHGGTPVMRGNCRPALYVDGILVTKSYGTVGSHGAFRGGRFDEFFWGMSTRDVEIIEVYLGAATLPGDFARLGVRCAVAVWTKRGGAPGP